MGQINFKENKRDPILKKWDFQSQSIKDFIATLSEEEANLIMTPPIKKGDKLMGIKTDNTSHKFKILTVERKGKIQHISTNEENNYIYTIEEGKDMLVVLSSENTIEYIITLPIISFSVSKDIKDEII